MDKKSIYHALACYALILACYLLGTQTAGAWGGRFLCGVRRCQTCCAPCYSRAANYAPCYPCATRSNCASCRSCPASRTVAPTASCQKCFGSTCPTRPNSTCSGDYCPTCPNNVCSTSNPIDDAIEAGWYTPDNPTGTKEATDAALEALSAMERELIAEANRVRGRFVLKFDATVNARSQYNSQCQAERRQLGHFTGDANEIAGMGYASARAAIQGWLNSPAHRAILLRSNYTKVGASVKRGSNGVLYWTMNFGY